MAKLLFNPLIFAFLSSMMLNAAYPDRYYKVGKQIPVEQLQTIKVNTVSRMLEESGEAPSHVVVITQHDIKTRGYVTLKDVLKDLPGWEVNDWFYSEQGSQVAVRGFQGNAFVLLMINGMAINEPSSGNMVLRDDISIRDAVQIEIVYGTGAIMYGKNAVSAVINIITQHNYHIQDFKAWGGYGTNNTKEGTVSFKTFFGMEDRDVLSLSGLFHGLQSTPDNWSETFPDWYQPYKSSLEAYDMPIEPVRINNNYNSHIRISSEHASLSLFYRESKQSAAEGAWYGELLPDEKSYWQDRTFVADLRNAIRPSDRLEFESSIQYNWFDMDKGLNYLSPVFEPEGGSPILYEFKHGVSNGITIEENLKFFGEDEFSVITGLSFSYRNMVSKGGVFDENLGLLNNQNSPSPFNQVLSPIVTGDYYLFGGFVEAHMTTGKMKMVGGLRLERYSKIADVQLMPRLATVFTINEKMLAKVIVTQSYVVPNTTIDNLVYSNDSYLDNSSQSNLAERVMLVQGNYVYTNPKLMLSVSPYYSQYATILTAGASRIGYVSEDKLDGNVGPYDYLPFADSPFIHYNYDTGESHIYGVDFYVRYKFKSIWGWASYSYADSRIVDKTKSISNLEGLPMLSNHNVRLGVTYEGFDKRLIVTPSVWFKSTPDNAIDPVNLTDQYKNPYEINLFASYKLGKYFSVYTRIKNITNHKYATKGVTNYMPQETITILGGVKIDLKEINLFR